MNPHAFLDTLAPSTMKLGLDRMLACDAALGHPWRAYRSLHVAGTNGKGSTSAFAEAILRAAGRRVGLYTSPHLEAVNERLRIDGLDASDADLAAGIDAVVRAYPPAGDPQHEDSLTYFEFLTALALWLFRERGCDAAVIEVGLGGRLDATNVITPAAWAIATIGLDHTEYLGNTLAAIAREKAGIIKLGVPGAILTSEPEALAAIREVAVAQGARALEHPRDFGIDRAPGGQLRLPGRTISGISLALAGAHQLGNAALGAVGSTLAVGDVSDEAIRAGLATARWPGRLERVGDVILDGAHNAEGAAALASELERIEGPIHLVFGVLGDKDVARILQLLAPRVAGLHVVAPSNPRALAPERVLEMLRVTPPSVPPPSGEGGRSMKASPSHQARGPNTMAGPGPVTEEDQDGGPPSPEGGGTEGGVPPPAHACRSVPEAITEARAAVAEAKHGQVVVAGSLYLVGEARRWLRRGGGTVNIEESEYPVVTRDGWELFVTRFRVAPAAEHPLSGEPLLLIHGFSQNRLAWTAGELVATLVRAGVDVHLGELRGHGKSSIKHQHERHRKAGGKLPSDVDHAWDVDAYLVEDLPALIDGVKRASGRERIFYGGHSLGGILGYGHASLHDDFDGLVTLGATAEPGSDWWLLRLAAHLEPGVAKGVDSALGLLSSLRRLRGSSGKAEKGEPLRYSYFPMDAFLQGYGWLLAAEGRHELYGRLCAKAESLVVLSNPGRVVRAQVDELLRAGGEREPRPVTQQLASWVRTGRMRCDRAGIDLRASLGQVRVPTLVLYGEADKLANKRGTQTVMRELGSEYRRWVGIPGNGHLELTMGLDVGAICGHIQELMVYVRERRASVPR